MVQVCGALLIAPFNRAQPWLFKGKGLMKFGFFKGRPPLLCAPLCNDYRQVSRILALNRTGGLKRKWNWKTWVLCQNDEMMPKQLVYKAGVRTWGVGRCQMSWSQPFRKMAGASGSAPQRPSICAPLCLDARTHAVQAGTIVLLLLKVRYNFRGSWNLNKNWKVFSAHICLKHYKLF